MCEKSSPCACHILSILTLPISDNGEKYLNESLADRCAECNRSCNSLFIAYWENTGTIFEVKVQR